MEESMSSADDSMEDEEVSEVYGSEKKLLKILLHWRGKTKKCLKTKGRGLCY